MKKNVSALLKSLLINSSYSGKQKTMYVTPEAGTGTISIISVRQIIADRFGPIHFKVSK